MFTVVALSLGMLLPVETHSIPGGGKVVIRRAPGVQGRLWSSQPPGFRGYSRAVFNFDTPVPTISGDEVSFTDPSGKGNGSSSYSGMKLSFREGDQVEITLKATNMKVNFTAVDCTDGDSQYVRSVKHPTDGTITFSFTWRPKRGIERTRVVISGDSTGPAATGWGWTAGYAFFPGEAAPPATAASLDVSVADIQSSLGSPYFLMNYDAGVEISDIDRFAAKSPEPKGVAADGVSMLMVRAISDKPGQATFRLGGNGGALYPLAGSIAPLKSQGIAALEVKSRPLKDGKHVYLALYRPPSAYGKGSDKEVEFSVQADPEGSEGPGKAVTKQIPLIRPPVVLVHGTYDNPRFCYQDHDDQDDAPMNLGPQLQALGYRVWCVDWEEWNGSKDPSDFQTNKTRVWDAKDGIKQALTTMRGEGYAVTQADVVCHSQGGVITRTYCRGFPFSTSLPPTHKHYTDPVGCKQGEELCWYHRVDNGYRGDIHRLITISTTHRGSAVCNVFGALEKYPTETVKQTFVRLAADIFRVGVDKGVSGVTTGGFYNQMPDSLELQLIGPTPVPSHAIGCVATDHDMATVRPATIGLPSFKGDYYGKLYKIWMGTPDDAKRFAFQWMRDKAKGRGVANADALYNDFDQALTKVRGYFIGGVVPISVIGGPDYGKDLDTLMFAMRRAVFEGDENDCTVALTSSYGGLKPQFTFKAENTLHGWAPRYKHVQRRVIEVLTDIGGLLDPNGFPGYSGIQSKASTFNIPSPLFGETQSAPTTKPADDTGDQESKGLWSGSWDTQHSWGQQPLILTQKGDEVTGTYAGGVGRLKGKVTGRILKFSLYATNGEESVRGELEMAEDDNNTLIGKYYELSDPDKTPIALVCTRIVKDQFASNFQLGFEPIELAPILRLPTIGGRQLFSW